MKLIFAGTPEFAAQLYPHYRRASAGAGATQPDRPSGRGMVLRPSPVKALALEHGIEVFQRRTP